MFDYDDPLRVEYIDGRSWLLVEDFSYFDDAPEAGEAGRFIDVPLGFTTDFASIPRLFWTILPPAGQYGKAAVIHDWLYFSGRDGEGDPVTRAYADGVFLRAMKELGVPWHRRTVMYLAVRTFAGPLWAKRRKARP